jgi:hypothetical protein
MNNIKCFFLVVWLVFELRVANGSHVNGGQLLFSILSKDSIKFRYEYYRSCPGAVATNTIIVTIEPVTGANPGAPSCGTYTDTLTMISCSDVSNLCSRACKPCSQSSCNSASSNCSAPYNGLGVEKIIYEGIFVFPSNISKKCCYFRSSVQICCRNAVITTGSAAQDYYNYAEFNKCERPFVHSPVFNTEPVSIINRGKCQTLDFSVTKVNTYDSISYRLANLNTVDIGSKISYTSPNSYIYPLNGYAPSASQGGNPSKLYLRVKGATCSGFFLDSITGLITFKPSQVQISPLCVQVHIWRLDTTVKPASMKLRGIIRREIVINVLDTVENNLPIMDFSEKVNICAGDTLKLEDQFVSDIDTIKVGNNWIPRDTVYLQEYLPKLKGATFSKTRVGNSMKWSLIWPTSDSLISSQPYILGFGANDNYCTIPGTTFKNIQIYVRQKVSATFTATIDTACYYVHLKANPDTTLKDYQYYKYNWQVGNNFYYVQDTIVSVTPGKTLITLMVSCNGGCDFFLKDSINTPNHFYITTSTKDTAFCKYSTNTIYLIPHFNNGSINYTVNNVSLGSTDSLSIKVLSDTILNISAIDGKGCYSYIRLKITSEKPFLNSGKYRFACNNDTVAIDAGFGYNGSPQNLTYLWYSPLKPNSIISTKRTLYTVDSGIYYIHVIDSSTSCSEYDTIKVNKIMGLPQVARNTHFCAGGEVKLVASGTDSITWSYRSNGVIYSDSASINYTNDSSTSFVLKGVTKKYGLTCVGYDTIHLFREDLPVVNLGNDTALCSSSISLVYNAGAGGANYLWEDSSTAQTHTVTAAGQIWVKVTNNYGCVGHDSINIKSLNPLVNLGRDTSFCDGQSISLTLNAQSAGNNICKWQDGTMSNTYQVSAVGLYWVKVTNPLGCSSTDSIEIISSTAPIIHLGNDTTIKQGDSLLLDAGAGMMTYMWNTGATSQNVYAKDSGKYIVKVTNQAGCDGADTIVIVTLTGISQPVDETIYTIYPNPTSKYVHIDCNNKNLLPKYCELYTMDGKYVKRLSATGGDVSELSNGFYLLYIHSPQGLMIRKLEVRQ